MFNPLIGGFENLKSPKRTLRAAKQRVCFFSVMHKFQALGGDRVQQVPMRPSDAQAKKRAKEQRKLLGSTWPFRGFLEEGGKSCNMKSLVKNNGFGMSWGTIILGTHLIMIYIYIHIHIYAYIYMIHIYINKQINK